MSALKNLSLVVAITTAAVVGVPAESFAQASKLTITGLDNGVVFTAQHNPKEIQVDKPVRWTKSKTSKSDQPQLETTGADGRSMSFELLFDTQVARTDVHGVYIAKLLSLAMVMDPMGAEAKLVPTRVKVTWGVSALQLEGVIESIAVTYTKFLPNGTPVRATCTVKLKEASRAARAR